MPPARPHNPEERAKASVRGDARAARQARVGRGCTGEPVPPSPRASPTLAAAWPLSQAVRLNGRWRLRRRRRRQGCWRGPQRRRSRAGPQRRMSRARLGWRLRQLRGRSVLRGSARAVGHTLGLGRGGSRSRGLTAIEPDAMRVYQTPGVLLWGRVVLGSRVVGSGRSLYTVIDFCSNHFGRRSKWRL